MSLQEAVRSKPIQLSWLTRIEKAERETRAKETKKQQILEFALHWTSPKPKRKLSSQTIAENLGISMWTVRRRIRDLLAEDPSVATLIHVNGKFRPAKNLKRAPQ